MQKGNPLREIGLLLTALVIVGLVTVVIIGTFRGDFLSKSSITQTPLTTTIARTPTSSVSLSPYPGPQDYQAFTEAARQTVTIPRLTQKASLLATHLAITPSPSPLTTYPPTGTVENMYVKPSGQKLGLDAQNAWFGLVGGIKVDLYAGALLDDLNQGALYLFMEFPQSSISELILTPTKHGGVRVVSEQNNRLTMISTDGTTYYFDVPARRFVNSLAEVVPSATPPATRTPLPLIPTPVTSLSTPNPYPAPTESGPAMP